MKNFLKDLIFKSDFDNKSIQFPRFILVGGFTTFLDFLLLFLQVEYFEINYLLAAAISFLIGSSVNYLLSVYWVFLNGKFSNQLTEFSVFILFTFLGLVLNQGIMYLGTSLVLLPYTVSKIVSIVIVTIFNFFTKKYIVFIK